jgi:hypothetical protein
MPPQEIRFAVVLYGGVSMAIYINGVVQELLRLVRANGGDITDRPNLPSRLDHLRDQLKSSIAGAVCEESQGRSNLDQSAAR